MPSQRSDEFTRLALPQPDAVVPTCARGPPSIGAERDVRDLSLMAGQPSHWLQLPTLLRRELRGLIRSGPRREQRPQKKRMIV